MLKLFLNSKISGIAIKCYVGGGVDGTDTDIRVETECPQPVTQCYKGYTNGKVFFQSSFP